MHRFYLPMAGVFGAALAVVFLAKTPPDEPRFVHVESLPNIFDLENPDLSQVAVSNGILTANRDQIEVTQSQMDDPSRVNSIVAFFNRDGSSENVDLIAVHIVEPGDSINSIAQHYYGNAEMAKHIFLANRHDLTPNHQIKVGQSLRIPAI